MKSIYATHNPDHDNSELYVEFIEQLNEHKEMLIAVGLLLYAIYRVRWIKRHPVHSYGQHAQARYNPLMPLYQYRSLNDGETIELLRSMADADKPVDDPKGKGRKFVRTHSTFQVAGSPASKPAHRHTGPGCGCGNPHGPCNS